MKTAATIFLVLAGLGFVTATQSVMFGVNKPAEPENFAGYAVGAYLGPVLMAAIGLYLWDRAAKQKRAADSAVDAQIVDSRLPPPA